MTKTLQAIRKAKALLKEQGLEDWSVYTNNSCYTIGKVKFDKKEIFFSRRFIDIATEEEFYRATMHEIAHALLPYGKGHGAEFVEKCRELNPDQPYDKYCTGSPIQRFKLKCSECGFSELTNSSKDFYCPKGHGMHKLSRTDNVLEQLVWASTP